MPEQALEVDGRAYRLRTLRVAVEDPQRDLGFSSLARHPDGSLWSASEETHRLLRLGPVEGDRVASHSQRLYLGPAGLEVEGLAFLPDGRVVFATEGFAERGADALAFGDLREAPAWTIARQPRLLDYRPWELRAPHNQGLEGVASVGTELVVAVEAVVGQGARFAPLARLATPQAEPLRYRLRLSSQTGKLSAIDCRRGSRASSLECRAVERHFGVARILGFTLPAPHASGLREIDARVVADLSNAIGRCTNLEGLLWEEDRFTLIADNHNSTRTGPTWLLLLEPR